MRVAFVLLAACSAAPVPVVANTRVPDPGLPTIDFTPWRWRLQNSAKFADGGIAFRYCCTNNGEAETTVVLPPGSYWVGVTHHGDCEHAMALSVRFGKRWLSKPAVFGPSVGIIPVDVPVDLANQPLALHLYAVGGLHCCGSSTVTKIEIVPLGEHRDGYVRGGPEEDDENDE